MSFEIGKAFNGGAEWVCGSSAVFGVLRNPVFTALLITALALIIIYAMYKEDLKGTGWRKGFKAGFWLVIGVSALVFVHYYALERSLKQGVASQGVRNVMDSIHHSATVGGGYSVFPTGGDDEDGTDRANGAPSRAPPARPAPAPAGPPKGARPDNVAAAKPDIADLGLKEVVLTSTI